jgi:hypothetical protein
MKLCKCGKELIFKGGYCIVGMSIVKYECYECGNKVETMKIKIYKQV